MSPNQVFQFFGQDRFLVVSGVPPGSLFEVILGPKSRSWFIILPVILGSHPGVILKYFGMTMRDRRHPGSSWAQLRVPDDFLQVQRHPGIILSSAKVESRHRLNPGIILHRPDIQQMCTHQHC